MGFHAGFGLGCLFVFNKWGENGNPSTGSSKNILGTYLPGSSCSAFVPTIFLSRFCYIPSISLRNIFLRNIFLRNIFLLYSHYIPGVPCLGFPFSPFIQGGSGGSIGLQQAILVGR